MAGLPWGCLWGKNQQNGDKNVARAQGNSHTSPVQGPPGAPGWQGVDRKATVLPSLMVAKGDRKVWGSQDRNGELREHPANPQHSSKSGATQGEFFLPNAPAYLGNQLLLRVCPCQQHHREQKKKGGLCFWACGGTFLPSLCSSAKAARL